MRSDALPLWPVEPPRRFVRCVGKGLDDGQRCRPDRPINANPSGQVAQETENRTHVQSDERAKQVVIPGRT